MSTLYTIEATAGPPSLAEAAAKLRVAVSDLDASFGVVAIDPARHLYAVNVTSSSPAAGAAGPYANPRIEGFGPS